MMPGPPAPSGHLVSRCGILCDTCPAYRQGLCPGCPFLDAGECAVRDCADRIAAGACGECEQPSCYQFELFAERRRAMQAITRRRLLALRAHAWQQLAAAGQSLPRDRQRAAGCCRASGPEVGASPCSRSCCAFQRPSTPPASPAPASAVARR